MKLRVLAAIGLTAWLVKSLVSFTMAYTYGAAKLMSGAIDLDTHDIRGILVMSNTTADTEKDVEFVSGFSVLDECDWTGYSREALASEAVAVDTANDRGEFTSDVLTFGAIVPGSRAIVGLILYRHVTNDADSPVIAYYNLGTLNGNLTLTLTPNTEGLVQARAIGP